MLSWLWRWIKRSAIALAILLLLLLLPSAYIELACRADVKFARYSSIISDSQYQRTEANSFLTYPEWHIVYAYEGMAHVLETGDEHEFDYISSITGFWSSACALNRTSQQHGQADFVTRGVIHIIGISFTFELGMKALYEETLGRLFAIVRGTTKSPQDEYAAWMARNYSDFLQQTPWYEYDFDMATSDLWQKPVSSFLRGWERRLALGGEWKAKSAYASMIAGASSAAGSAAQRIRLVVDDITDAELQQLDNVTIIRKIDQRTIIEADRYRKLTDTMRKIADLGGQIVEIAGNDDILVTAIRPENVSNISINNASIISDIARDGYDDSRMLISSKVNKLTDLFAELESKQLILEHVYDY